MLLIQIAEQTQQGIPPSGIAMLVVFLAVFIGIGVYGVVQPRRSASRIAATRRLSYVKEDPSVMSNFATWPFYLGRGHKARDVMSGDFRGHAVTLFNFTFIDSQGSTSIDVGPLHETVGGAPKKVDVGIFAGLDPSLGVVTGASRKRSFDRGSGEPDAWGICVMEMPGPLPQVLIRPRLGAAESVAGFVGNLTGVTQDDDPAVADLPTGDPSFDAGFVVRSERPSILPTFLPQVTRDLLLASRTSMVHKSTHIWTWDRYLFTLDFTTLSEKRVDFRLPLMAQMIENAKAAGTS